jgi:hypothetical protein
MENAGQFDWAAKESIVVKRVDPIAIYTDDQGDIIIRQQLAASLDSVITIPARHVHSVIEGLQRELKGRFAPPLTAAAAS